MSFSYEFTSACQKLVQHNAVMIEPLAKRTAIQLKSKDVEASFDFTMLPNPQFEDTQFYQNKVYWIVQELTNSFEANAVYLTDKDIVGTYRLLSCLQDLAEMSGFQLGNINARLDAALTLRSLSKKHRRIAFFRRLKRKYVTRRNIGIAAASFVAWLSFANSPSTKGLVGNLRVSASEFTSSGINEADRIPYRTKLEFMMKHDRLSHYSWRSCPYKLEWGWYEISEDPAYIEWEIKEKCNIL